MNYFRKFICILLCLCIGCTQKITYQTVPAFLHACITSDLHYVTDGSGISTIMPLVAMSDDFTDCLINQVIDEQPDVFIMTGDITNSGSTEEFKKLSQHLSGLIEAGISIILTTGNHDYNKGEISAFREYLMPLIDIQEQDTHSLSYTSVINDVCFIAMDDGYETEGKYGSFSSETMNWLKQQLETARNNGRKIIFLSHHSVLYPDTDEDSFYTIHNRKLASLLEEYQVRICFTGHQHTQSHLKVNNMHEIISATPLSGSYLYGDFTIAQDDFSYNTETIDFNTYANEEFLAYYNEIQEESEQKFHDTYQYIVDEQDLSEEEKQAVLSLFAGFMTYVQDGTVSTHYDEIRQNPAYEAMLEAFADTNYGPWIKSIMSARPLNASALSFTW